MSINTLLLQCRRRFLGFLVGPVLPPIRCSPDLPLACHERRRQRLRWTLFWWWPSHRLSQARGRCRSKYRWLGPVVPPLRPATQGIPYKFLRCSRLALVPARAHSWDAGADRPSQASQSSSCLEEEGPLGSTGAARPCTLRWLLFAAGQPGCSQAAR
eukprot:2440871-Amphidinium_carterae.1